MSVCVCVRERERQQDTYTETERQSQRESCMFGREGKAGKAHLRRRVSACAAVCVLLVDMTMIKSRRSFYTALCPKASDKDDSFRKAQVSL